MADHDISRWAIVARPNTSQTPTTTWIDRRERMGRNSERGRLRIPRHARNAGSEIERMGVAGNDEASPFPQPRDSAAHHVEGPTERLVIAAH